MRAAVRPYATVGVALVGASVIAVAPAAGPLPDVHIPSLHVSVPVELTQVVDPITAYVDLFQNTFANLTSLAGQVLAAPAPILAQILTNQLGYLTTLATAAQTTVQSLVTYVTTQLPMSLQSAFALIRSGDLQDGLYNIFLAVVVEPVLSVATGLLPAIQTVVETPIENLLAAVQTTFGDFLPLGLGLITPFASLAFETAAIAQDLFNAVQARDLLGVVNTILAAPALLTNAVLNGAEPPGVLDGLLTAPQGFGTIQVLLNLRAAIAAAITPPVMLSTLAKSTATTAPSALPNLAANAVTVNTAKMLNTGPADPPSATGANAGPVAKVTTGKVIGTTETTGLTGGNAGGNGTKATGNQLSSTLSKITAALTKGTSPTAKTGTHK
jgi:hypothetical protein